MTESHHVSYIPRMLSCPVPRLGVSGDMAMSCLPRGSLEKKQNPRPGPSTTTALPSQGLCVIKRGRDHGSYSVRGLCVRSGTALGRPKSQPVVLRRIRTKGNTFLLGEQSFRDGAVHHPTIPNPPPPVLSNTFSASHVFQGDGDSHGPSAIRRRTWRDHEQERGGQRALPPRATRWLR